MTLFKEPKIQLMEPYSQTPIFRKSKEIFETLKTVTALFPEENEILIAQKNQLIENIMIIQSKLAGSDAVKLYDLKMENATLIRKAARELLVSYHKGNRVLLHRS